MKRLIQIALAAGLLLAARPAAALPVRADVVGEITGLTLNDPADHWSGGTMVVGGERYLLPRNLLLDCPASRSTLTEAFEQAPLECVLLHESGLAKTDACRHGQSGAIATVIANRTDGGNAIAGVVNLAKGTEFMVGTITFIDFTNGFFRINGTPGSATAGSMVRINDPQGVHTVQRGPGCVGTANNCSADVRFTEDPLNFTNFSANGFPICIPSTVATAQRTHPAAADGTGDAFCPATNRGGSTVADSTRFAPLLVGDNVIAQGNWEIIAGVEFLSAWSVQLNTTLLTRDDPTQPDYVRTSGAKWDAPGFDANRQRFFILGAATLPSKPLEVAVDVFSLHTDPLTNAPHEKPLMSTVNNALAIGFGAPKVNFQVHYNVDFLVAAVGRSNPCSNLINAGFVCERGGIPGSFDVLSPIAREIRYRTRHQRTLNPGVVARDINGNVAQQGEYVTPVSLSFLDFIEVDPARGQTPFLLEGVPWLADRRLGPQGCLPSGCESTPQPLDPFPFSGRDARTATSADLALGVPAPPVPDPERIYAFWPFGPTDHFAFSQVNPTAVTLAAPTPVGLGCAASVFPPPTLTGVTPGSGMEGSGLSVLLAGTGFRIGATCSFGAGINAACNVTSASSVTAVLDIDPLAPVGPRDVTLKNPDGQGATLAAAFAVTALPTLAPPLLTSVTPSHFAFGTSGGITLAGTNFVPGATCTFGSGVSGDCSVAPGGKSAHATVIVDVAAVPGPRDVTFVNPDGQRSTALGGLTIDPAGPAATATLVATVNPVVAAGSTVLQFSTTNATAFTLDPLGALATASGSITVTPASTTTYTLTATGPGGTATASVTVAVTPAGPAAPTANLIAAPPGIVAGSSSVLNFASTGGTSAVLAPTGGAVALNGTFTVTPSTTTTYTFLVTGPGGIASATVVVVVTPAPPPPPLFDEALTASGVVLAAWQNLVGRFALGPTSVTGVNSLNEARVAGLSVLDLRVDATVIASRGGLVGVRMRADPAASQGANYFLALTSRGALNLYRRTGGVDTLLASVQTAADLTAPHTLTAVVTGAGPVSIVAQLDGVPLIHFSDGSASAIKTAGGVLISSGAGGQLQHLTISAP